MAAPGLELLVSVDRTAFVPVLVVGLGGAYTELLDRATIVLLPAPRERIDPRVADIALALQQPPLALIEPQPRDRHRARRRGGRCAGRRGGTRHERDRREAGEVGLPAPVSELAAKPWDAVIVGGGHNGLTAAAYLARAGQWVLVLERRERLGGACTLERPFPDQRYSVSPCAYVVGLLDELVIRELNLGQRGFECYVADPNLWVPFEDGTSFGQWLDDAKTQRNLEELKVSKRDIAGYWAYEHVFDEIRQRLRTRGRDSWLDATPTRAELEDLLHGERHMIDIVFQASISDVLDEYLQDQRLKDALFGQGVIAAYGGPKDPGTASIKLMHYQGDLEGQGPVWGYVKGGMGMISFAIADAAREAGATLATGVPVSAITPGEGVTLEDGTVIRARTVLCNADPKRALAMLTDLPDDYRARLDAWKIRSPVVKFNAALTALPEFTAAPGATWPARATVDVTEASTPPSAPSSAAPPASPRSASARSTSRPGTTTPRRRPTATCCPSSASTRPTTWTGPAAGTRSHASSST